MATLYPLKFTPILKEKIWGGNKIETILKHKISPLKNCGESWELSGIIDDESVFEKEFKHPDYTETLNITKNSLSGLYHILNGNITLRYVSDLNHVIFHKFNDRIAYSDEQGFHIISKPLHETANECED